VTDVLDSIRRQRRTRVRRYWLVTGTLAVLVLALALTTLMVGREFVGPLDVLRVILGEDVPGAGFTVGTLRLPRMVLGLLSGLAFGLAGITFQTMLRNALAAPDVIGITAGAGAAAAFAIVVFHLSATMTSIVAVIGALVVSLGVLALSFRGGVFGTRVILIGIGVAAFFDAVIAYVSTHLGTYQDQTALLRWFTGSLNGATWVQILPLALAVVAFGGVLLGVDRGLGMLRLGDDAASGLGVRVARTRVVAVLVAAALVAFATAATGPIAFVAFLAGPIAARLIRGSGSPLLPSALVGAALVLAADLIGQWLLPTRLPVGVVTGAIGAPYLLYLLIRSNRSGGTL
jgi:iron complex transport system permease protein